VAVLDAGMFNQLKKGQGETNERLDKLIAAQERTNQLLEWLGGLIQASGKPAGSN
jgi:hypothetical protein